MMPIPVWYCLWRSTHRRCDECNLCAVPGADNSATVQLCGRWWGHREWWRRARRSPGVSRLCWHYPHLHQQVQTRLQLSTSSSTSLHCAWIIAFNSVCMLLILLYKIMLYLLTVDFAFVLFLGRLALVSGFPSANVICLTRVAAKMVLCLCNPSLKQTITDCCFYECSLSLLILCHF